MDIGAVINQQYQVIEHIGRGGMADVWSARDTRLRRMVAIKTIAAGLGSDLDPVTLFKREAHTIAQMEHPHILPIYDFGEYDNSLYIVMRYMTAGSLEDLLRGGPLAPEEVIRLGEAVGQALDYAHSNSVIHLDLKPPNILLDSSKSPYLADFGLATALDPEGRANNPGSGTLLYMAPEQMIAETLDHRADIYSFSIMLFHMFTGRLPFDGTAPLAMQQVQRGEEMPYLDDYVSNLPSDLTTVLRVGTAQDPLLRPETHMDIMQQVREILQPSGYNIMGGADLGFEGDMDSYNLPTEPYEGISDSDLLEAVDIYSRARYNWQGGQGRFLLGVTHFMLMSEYYQNAKQHGLSIDQHGYQMLLRGALEYDHELNYWWGKVNNDDRRWVCLHALRSGNAPARIRALYRLETLPDEEGTGVIPRLVAQALEIETDESAKLAALTVLGTRARLMKRKPKMQIMTEYRGRLITTMTRLGIELTTSGEWQEVVYSKDVDLLVAEQAFDGNRNIADFAARTIGKMRSLTAVTHISNQQIAGRAGALRALAFVRDEAPSLPDIVSREARFYAWITNTIRRLSENPLETVLRFALVFLAGWIGLGDHVYSYFRIVVGSLGSQRWSNSLGMGISFGVLLGLTYLLSSEISRRLKGFWPWWMRMLVAGTLGYIMATISYASYRFLFMQEPPVSIAWDEMRFAGAALVFALVASQILELRAWQSILFTILLSFLPVYATFQAYYDAQNFTILPIAVVMLLVGVFCGWRAEQLQGSPPAEASSSRFMPIFVAIIFGLVWSIAVWLYSANLYSQMLTGLGLNWDIWLWLAIASIAIGAVFAYLLKHYRYLSIGVLVSVAIFLYRAGLANQVLGRLDFGWDIWVWLALASVALGAIFAYLGGHYRYAPLGLIAVLLYRAGLYSQAEVSMGFPWDAVIWLSALSIIFGAFFSYWLKRYRYTFAAVALLSFGVVYGLLGWFFFDYSYVLPMSQPAFTVTYYSGVPLLPVTEQPIFNHESDSLANIFHITLSMYIVMALGLHMRELLTSWWNWVGAPRTARDRGAWLSLTLTYVMVMTALISVLSLFTSGQNRLWELAWGGWAFLTFVFALAAFRWAKWGARGLLISAIVLLVGAFAYDFAIMHYATMEGRWPEFLQVIPIELPFSNDIINATQIYFWAIWSVVLGVFVWGAMRRALWAGIGLVVMLVGWFVVSIFSPVMGSMAVFAITNVALVAYALSTKYQHMEEGRWPLTAQPVVPVSQLVAAPETEEAVTMETQIFTPDASPVPATQLVAMDDVLPKKVSASDMMTELDVTGEAKPMDTVQFEQDKPDLDMDTAPQIKIDTEALRTQFPTSDGPIISIGEDDIISKPAPKDPPKLKLDLGDIRNQRTVRFTEEPPKAESKDEDEAEE